MALTQAQTAQLRVTVKRTLYAATLLRRAGDITGHQRVVADYCTVALGDYGIPVPVAMGILVGAGMDALVDVLGETAEADLRNALFELDLDGE